MVLKQQLPLNSSNLLRMPLKLRNSVHIQSYQVDARFGTDVNLTSGFLGFVP